MQGSERDFLYFSLVRGRIKHRTLAHASRLLVVLKSKTRSRLAGVAALENTDASLVSVLALLISLKSDDGIRELRDALA